MNKKVILAVSAVAIILIAVGVYFSFFRQFSLRLTSDVQDLEIELKSRTNKTAKPVRLKVNQTVHLRPGKYDLKSTSDKYQLPNQTINLINNQSLDLRPDYSDKYTKETFKNDLKTITNMIEKKYPTVGFDILQSSTFKQRGQYFIAAVSIFISPNTSDIVEIYKIIYKRQGNTWQQLNSQPALIFNQQNHPNIPADILQAANSIL